MSLLLCIETSTSNCSVALVRNGIAAAARELNEARAHAGKVTVFIREVLEQCGVPADNLDAVAVGKGPGSYTGLRIGVSVAKGLCYALKKPLIAIDTLYAMAHAMQAKRGEEQILYCPMTDARRMEVYCSLFDKDLKCLMETSALVINSGSFADTLQKNKVLFFGDGARKCREVLTHQENALFAEGVYPAASDLAVLAAAAFREKRFEDLAYFEPFYLKDFLAGTPRKQV